MKYILAAILMTAVLSGYAYSSDFRISVGVGYRPAPVHPICQPVMVERPSVIWVPPVYERRVDADGNIYVVLVREGYYQEIRPAPVIYTPPPIYHAPACRPVYYPPCPRPTFGFGFSFGTHGSSHRHHH